MGTVEYSASLIMNALFQLLSDQDVPTLLELMREFYADQHMTFDPRAAAAAIEKLLANPANGQVYLLFLGPDLAGYFALTFGFSLEFHGRFGLLDELYIREAFRRRKLGRACIEFAERICREKHLQALRLEVGDSNHPAQQLYRSAGFAPETRRLFTRWL